jgi:hypothetical protein
MLGLLSVFSFDFLALECLDNGGNSYFLTVYLWCVLPIAFAFIIVFTGMVRVMMSKSFKRETVNERTNQTAVKNQHIWLLLFLTYLVLPPVSNKQLQVFDCVTVNDNRYLRSDTSIDCDKSNYLNFSYIVLLFIGLYQCIPIMWMYILHRKKASLNPYAANHDEKLAMYIRNRNPDLAPIRFLFVDYKCSKWWFEIADMYRRIVFIGIVPLVSPRTSIRSSFGILLSIVSIVYFREEQPYRIEFTNVIAHIAQITILGTFYSALSIETGAMINFGLEGVKLGVFLVLFNMIITALSFWFAWSRFQKQKMLESIKENKVSMNEDARVFSDHKFSTTFGCIQYQRLMLLYSIIQV